ncbi:MAG: hypothetical protein MJ118_08945, partial [Clostridia bacterium]|nr:hypothetical protein [Clostridia bacterium]
LLLHAWSCLIESHGLGVGLGNTETLAARRLDISVWEGNTQDSIHCFLARLAADYGVFALLPLCAIAFLLLKQVFFSLSAAIRRRDRRSIAYSLSLFAALLAFPIISTASSDAQDDLFMWFYLSMLVILSTEPSLISGEKVLEHESMDRY